MERLKFSFLSCLVILCLLFIKTASGQTNSPAPSLDPQLLPLGDLSQFETYKSEKWKTAGHVNGSRNQERELEIAEGKGILVYLPKKKGNKRIQTKLQHGDIDLNLDFLLSGSAAFTILLQGRYEVKIADKWLKEGYNALKAPGLWQHLSIRFKAPEFDVNGKKIKNARFEEILLNGQSLQKSTELTISENSPYKDEKDTDQIFIDGENTSFAIRNISYKVYQKEEIRLSDIRFKVYKGLYKSVDTLQTLTPKRTGITDTVSHRVGDRKSQLVFEGFANIPTDGEYLFKLTAGGGAWLFIDGKLIVENRDSRDFEKPFYAKQTLRQGRYPFKIVYSNSDECLVLGYEGPQIPWHSLTTPASVRLRESFPPLEYRLKNKPAIQRGFMIQNGVVNPYIAAVGIPENNTEQGFNYAYDMKKYNLSAVWHGKYIDVSNMWTGRGEKQLEIPLGAKLSLSGEPLLYKTFNENTSWPDSVQAPEGVYKKRGYRLNNRGLPTFYYSLGSTSVEDTFYPNQNKTGLTRELKIQNPDETHYCLLAEGKTIEKLSDGSFTVDDKNYYISDPELNGLQVKISHGAQGDKLVATLPARTEFITIKYNIIW